MAKLHPVRILCAILLIFWMAFIFVMSSHEGTKSTGDSEFVGRYVGRIMFSDFDSWPIDEQDAFAEKIDGFVRKSAHVIEYMILSIFATGTLLNKKYSLIFGLAYAAMDEVHQFFVPGRSCQITDVIIDFAGCVVGTLIVIYISTRGKKLWKR